MPDEAEVVAEELGVVPVNHVVDHGSLACAQHATCPVLVIHGSTPPPAAG